MTKQFTKYRFEVDGDDRVFTFDGLIDTIGDNYVPELHDAPELVAKRIRKILEAIEDAPIDKWVGEVEGFGKLRIVKNTEDK